jgi:hypothetical protein
MTLRCGVRILLSFMVAAPAIGLGSCSGSETTAGLPGAASPQVTISASTLTFVAAQGTNPAAQSLTVTTTGSPPLSWTAASSASWLTVSPTSGSGQTTITVTVNVAGMNPGNLAGTITIAAAGASNSPQSLGVALTVSAAPLVGVSPTDLSYSLAQSTTKSSQTLNITNTGTGTLSWTAASNVPWLTLSAASGTAPSSITVSADPSGKAAGTFTGGITITGTNASNSPRTVPVTLTIAGYNGSWSGKTSQDSTLRLTIANDAITSLYFGWVVAACGSTGTMASNFPTPVSVTSGSFTASAGSTPLTYTIAGTFSSPIAVSGTLTVNLSSIPGVSSCNASTTTSWSATLGGGGGGTGTPAAMAKSAGDGQSAAVGTTVPIAPAVIIKDASGNPVANQTVTFSVGSGGGSVTGATAVTSSAGIATVGSWRLGSTAGANTLIATSGNLPAVTFTATSTATSGGGSFTGNFLAWTDFSDVQHVNRLVRVNGQTGAVTNIGGSDFLPAMAYGPDGTLYGVSDRLVSINPSTGATALVGLFLFQGKQILMAAATFSPSGTLFVRENDTPARVFTVNLTNGGLTLVGTPTETLAGMAFDNAGTLYGSFTTLFTINPATAAGLSTIGKTPTFISILALGAGGTMYGMDIYPSSRLFALSLSNASATSTMLVGCGCLVSLVAERSSASAAVTGFNRVAVRGLQAPPYSVEALRERARAIQAQHRARLQGRPHS